jgi:hypothetical protein
MKWDNTIENLVVGVLGFLLIASAILLNGAVLSQLWGWFIVPLGVPVVGIVQASGLVLAARLVVFQDCANDKDEDHPRISWFVKTFVTPLAFLFAGWLIHLCG